MSDYSPSSVPLTGLTEAAVVGVNLSLEEQALTADSGSDIGLPTGYVGPVPGEIDG
jgi:hypothetical protein